MKIKTHADAKLAVIASWHMHAEVWGPVSGACGGRGAVSSSWRIKKTVVRSSGASRSLL